jgi:hypothetical protein
MWCSWGVVSRPWSVTAAPRALAPAMTRSDRDCRHAHRRGRAQHSTAQHSTAQHSTAQHSTAQHTQVHACTKGFSEATRQVHIGGTGTRCGLECSPMPTKHVRPGTFGTHTHACRRSHTKEPSLTQPAHRIISTQAARLCKPNSSMHHRQAITHTDTHTHKWLLPPHALQ